MPKSKRTLGIDYTEFNILSEQLKQLDGNIKETTETALKKSQRYVHQKIGLAMQPHNKTYATIRSLVDNPPVMWVGNTRAEIGVGFDIGNDGLASIFLMYGVKAGKNGTPRRAPDKNLYNAIFGKKTSDEIAEIQREVFFSEIERLMRR